MVKDKIVQFVSFETSLNEEQFITQWEQYNRSVNSDLYVTLQQSEKNGRFSYIAQHRCLPGELKFSFTRAKKSSRNPEPEIKARQAGGYLLLQEERAGEVRPNETKVFAFSTDTFTNAVDYKSLAAHGKLNIYGAYYENCQYTFILEFFIKSGSLAPLLEQLETFGTFATGVYKECALQQN